MTISKGRPGGSEAGGDETRRDRRWERAVYSRHDCTREGIGSGHATGGLGAFARARFCY